MNPKSLYKVYAEVISIRGKSNVYEYYVYAHSNCHAMQIIIKHLHERLAIPLDCIDVESINVYKILNFLK